MTCSSLDEKILDGLYDDLNTPKVIAELNVLTNTVSKADEKEKEIKRMLDRKRVSGSGTLDMRIS